MKLRRGEFEAKVRAGHLRILGTVRARGVTRVNVVRTTGKRLPATVSIIEPRPSRMLAGSAADPDELARIAAVLEA